MTTGYLIDVQHFSVNDGDGIRSTIFFAGCNMRCQWCANPESFTTFDKILHSAASCIACGRCEMVCPYGSGSICRIRWRDKNAEAVAAVSASARPALAARPYVR